MVAPGSTYVAGIDAPMARALLDAAAEVGYSSDVVRVSNGGFVVPDAVADAAADAINQTTPPTPGNEF